MKVLMLLEGEFPPDERVEKEIQTLIEQGHDLHIACLTRKDRPNLESTDGLVIHRIKISSLMYKLSALILILPFYKNIWFRYVKRLFLKNRYDIIHVHDLPLSIIGMKLKRKYGTKLVCDQHEYYSNWIVDTAHYNTFLGKFVKLLSNWKKYERKALHYADKVITVEEPLKEIYTNEYQLPSDKIFVLPNTPNMSLFHSSNVDPKLFEQYKNSFVLLYFGGIDILRGIDYIINAIPAIIPSIPNFKFVLAGTIRKGYDPIRSAKKLGVEAYVDYLGWLDRKQLPSLIDASHLGAFTPEVNRTEINKTIATKNYQFLVMGKPIMVGRATYMKEFTETNKIGFSVDERRADEISEKIIAFFKDEKRQQELKEYCTKIGKNYYWEHTSQSLIECYKLLVN